MNALKRRLDQLEEKRGNREDAWINALSDEELDAAIAAIHASMRQNLEASGHSTADMTDDEVVAYVQQQLGESQ